MIRTRPVRNMLEMSTADSAMDEDAEVNVNVLSVNPQADAQIGEPHKHVHNVQEEFMENQEKMLDQVKTSQEQLQQRLDTICKGLEGIMTTKYDAQVEEYHQNRLHERERMRSEIRGEVTDAIKANGDKVMDVIQATYNKAMEST